MLQNNSLFLPFRVYQLPQFLKLSSEIYFTVEQSSLLTRYGFLSEFYKQELQLRFN